MSCDSHSPLWRLGYVCRDWRAVAMGTPSLWSDIHVELRVRPDEDLAKERRVLRGWLKNASNHKLAVHVEVPDPAIILRKFEGLFEVLLEYSHQFRSLTLRMHKHDILPYFSKLEGNSEHLTFLRIETSSHTVIQSRVETFLTAPNLRSVELHGCSHAIIRLPLSQLTHHLGGDLGIPDELLVPGRRLVSSWLAPFIGLTSAVFNMPGTFLTTYVPRTCFPALVSLRVSFACLLGHIEAPVLARLAIDDPTRFAETSICIAFVKNSSIEEFEVHNWNENTSVLAALPDSVTRLSIVQSAQPGPREERFGPLCTLYALLSARTGKYQRLLPRLGWLEVSVPCIEDVELRELDMVLSKRSKCFQLPGETEHHLARLCVRYRGRTDCIEAEEIRAAFGDTLELYLVNEGPVVICSPYRFIEHRVIIDDAGEMCLRAQWSRLTTDSGDSDWELESSEVWW